MERKVVLQQLEQEFQTQESISIDQYLKRHIDRLHTYNEQKDIGQMLLGQCAERTGRTTKEMYIQFKMELTD